MLSNYIKLAVRNLTNQKIYTTINILGLSLGITACLLIAIFVYQELSYDNFHANGERIYRVGQTRISSIITSSDKGTRDAVRGAS